jgi:hypothetical protein
MPVGKLFKISRVHKEPLLIKEPDDNLMTIEDIVGWVSTQTSSTITLTTVRTTLLAPAAVWQFKQRFELHFLVHLNIDRNQTINY